MKDPVEGNVVLRLPGGCNMSSRLQILERCQQPEEFW